MKTLLTITAVILLATSLAFAGPLEVSQTKLQAIWLMFGVRES